MINRIISLNSHKKPCNVLICKKLTNKKGDGAVALHGCVWVCVGAPAPIALGAGGWPPEGRHHPCEAMPPSPCPI